MSQISKINPEELAISEPVNVISCIEINEIIDESFTIEINCPASVGTIAVSACGNITNLNRLYVDNPSESAASHCPLLIESIPDRIISAI